MYIAIVDGFNVKYIRSYYNKLTTVEIKARGMNYKSYEKAVNIMNKLKIKYKSINFKLIY